MFLNVIAELAQIGQVLEKFLILVLRFVTGHISRIIIVGTSEQFTLQHTILVHI